MILPSNVKRLKTDLKAQAGRASAKGCRRLPMRSQAVLASLRVLHGRARQVPRSPSCADQGLRRRLRHDDRCESARTVEPQVRTTEGLRASLMGFRPPIRDGAFSPAASSFRSDSARTGGTNDGTQGGVANPKVKWWQR